MITECTWNKSPFLKSMQNCSANKLGFLIVTSTFYAYWTMIGKANYWSTDRPSDFLWFALVLKVSFESTQLSTFKVKSVIKFQNWHVFILSGHGLVALNLSHNTWYIALALQISNKPLGRSLSNIRIITLGNASRSLLVPVLRPMTHYNTQPLVLSSILTLFFLSR